MTMQSAALLFPDVSSLFVGYVRDHLDNSTSSPFVARYAASYGPPSSIKVAVDSTGWRRPEPLVQIFRVGGSQHGVWDEPRVQIDVLAEDWDSAHDLVQLVRVALQSAPGHLPEVKHVRERMGPTWMPEPGIDQPRFTWIVQVLVAGTYPA